MRPQPGKWPRMLQFRRRLPLVCLWQNFNSFSQNSKQRSIVCDEDGTKPRGMKRFWSCTGSSFLIDKSRPQTRTEFQRSSLPRSSPSSSSSAWWSAWCACALQRRFVIDWPGTREQYALQVVSRSLERPVDLRTCSIWPLNEPGSTALDHGLASRLARYHV